MPDMKNVINGLEKCAAIHQGFICESCEYPGDDCAIDDALALLQAQEPKPVHVTADINYRKIGECPNCSKVINSGDYPNYCGRCGQAVKWE